MLGISIKAGVGVGDALQFCSVPENFYRAMGEKLFDVSKNWFFDFNPYISRDVEDEKKVTHVKEMWNFSPKKYNWPCPREKDQPRVYLSNAELHASVWAVPVTLNRPRLYRFEDFPFKKRRMILLHTDGQSHGEMPQHIIDHVIKKYAPTGCLFHIGKSERNLGIPKIQTETLWDLARVISESRMLIGMDSGPSWIAACYPDVVVKKIRSKPSPEFLKTWVPLAIDNCHAHWDDRCHQIFNPSENDVGFTSSYRRI